MPATMQAGDAFIVLPTVEAARQVEVQSFRRTNHLSMADRRQELVWQEAEGALSGCSDRQLAQPRIATGRSLGYRSTRVR
jgi:hypothetical protein